MPKREFMYVDDLADAAIKVMNLSKKKFDTTTGMHNNFLNVGYGKHYSILTIAKIIKNAIGYKGNIKFDKSYPDGVYQKLMNSKKINKIGWKPKHDFKKYLKKIALNAYQNNKIN